MRRKARTRQKEPRAHTSGHPRTIHKFLNAVDAAAAEGQHNQSECFQPQMGWKCPASLFWLAELGAAVGGGLGVHLGVKLVAAFLALVSGKGECCSSVCFMAAAVDTRHDSGGKGGNYQSKC